MTDECDLKSAEAARIERINRIEDALRYRSDVPFNPETSTAHLNRKARRTAARKANR